MKLEPSKRQTEVLNFLTRHISKVGYPPTLREIAKHLGIRGFSAIKKHLDALEKKGHLSRRSGARAIEIPDRPQAVSVPVLGRVAAGKPILAEENLLGTLAVDPTMVRGRNVFLLKVKGESMKEAGILAGDLVLVKPQPDAESGEIVVAMVESEATVKRLIKKTGRIVLQPENPAFDPILITERDETFQILGKVMGVLRLPGLS